MDKTPHTDTAVRYMFPYPLAALYHLIHTTHEPSAQFGFKLRFVEGVFRFLGLINLADAISAGAPDDKVKKCNQNRNFFHPVTTINTIGRARGAD